MSKLITNKEELKDYIKKLNRLKLKTGVDLGINVAESGLHIPHGKVVISSNDSIGSDCLIFSGVTIADNVCIGANAVVVKDILEAGTTVVGIPAKTIE